MSALKQTAEIEQVVSSAPPFSEMTSADLESIARDQIEILTTEAAGSEVVLAEYSLQLVRQELRERRKKEIINSVGIVANNLATAAAESAKNSAATAVKRVGEKISGFLDLVALGRFMLFDTND